MQLLRQHLRIRKPVRIPGENAKTIHVIDVDVNRVERHAALPKRARHRQHFLGSAVTPPTVVITKRPARRYPDATGQLREALNDLSRRRPSENVVDKWTTIDTEATPLWRFTRQVELQTITAVDEHAPRVALINSQYERYRRVHVVQRRRMRNRRIEVPEHLVRAGFVQSARALSASEVMRRCGVTLVYPRR